MTLKYRAMWEGFKILWKIGGKKLFNELSKKTNTDIDDNIVNVIDKTTKIKI